MFARPPQTLSSLYPTNLNTAGFNANAMQLIASLGALNSVVLHVRNVFSQPETTFIDVLQDFQDVSRGQWTPVYFYIDLPNDFNNFLHAKISVYSLSIVQHYFAKFSENSLLMLSVT